MDEPNNQIGPNALSLLNLPDLNDLENADTDNLTTFPESHNNNADQASSEATDSNKRHSSEESANSEPDSKRLRVDVVEDMDFNDDEDELDLDALMNQLQEHTEKAIVNQAKSQVGDIKNLSQEQLSEELRSAELSIEQQLKGALSSFQDLDFDDYDENDDEGIVDNNSNAINESGSGEQATKDSGKDDGPKPSNSATDDASNEDKNSETHSKDNQDQPELHDDPPSTDKPSAEARSSDLPKSPQTETRPASQPSSKEDNPDKSNETKPSNSEPAKDSTNKPTNEAANATADPKPKDKRFDPKMVNLFPKLPQALMNGPLPPMPPPPAALTSPTAPLTIEERRPNDPQNDLANIANPKPSIPPPPLSLARRKYLKDQLSEEFTNSTNKPQDDPQDDPQNLRNLLDINQYVIQVRKKSIYLLDILASQVLDSLSAPHYQDTLATVTQPLSEKGIAYRILLDAFEDIKRVYFPLPVKSSRNGHEDKPEEVRPFLPYNIEGIDPSRANLMTIQRTNLATFMAAIYGSIEIGFWELENWFIRVFVPRGGRLLKQQSTILLDLKTQAYISAIEGTENADARKEALEELFPVDLEKKMHDLFDERVALTPTEKDFVAKCFRRKENISEGDSAALSAKYHWVTFLREISDYIQRNHYTMLPARANDEESSEHVRPTVYRTTHSKYNTSSRVDEYHPRGRANQRYIAPTRNKESSVDKKEDKNDGKDANDQGSGASSGGLFPPLPRQVVVPPSSPEAPPQPQPHPKIVELHSDTLAAYEAAKASAEGTDAIRPKASLFTTRRNWTQEEEEALLRGMDRVQGPYWAQILELYGPGGKISEVLKDRSQVQLKDKARNLKMLFVRLGFPIPAVFQYVTGDYASRRGSARKVKPKSGDMRSPEAIDLRTEKQEIQGPVQPVQPVQPLQPVQPVQPQHQAVESPQGGQSRGGPGGPSEPSHAKYPQDRPQQLGPQPETQQTQSQKHSHLAQPQPEAKNNEKPESNAEPITRAQPEPQPEPKPSDPDSNSKSNSNDSEPKEPAQPTEKSQPPQEPPQPKESTESKEIHHPGDVETANQENFDSDKDDDLHALLSRVGEFVDNQ